jgi:transposase
MRGSDERTGSLFSYVDLDSRVGGDHPLRTIRGIVNAALSDLSRAFSGLYTEFGRPSIAPEKLLRAMLLEVFGWIKSSAGLAKVKLRGRDRVDAAFTLALAAYNLIRLPKLLAAPA